MNLEENYMKLISKEFFFLLKDNYALTEMAAHISEW